MRSTLISSTTLLFLTLPLLSTAAPLTFTFPLIPRTASLSEAQVLTIAPTSNTCNNAPAKGECATAKTAAKYTAQSFDSYNVTSKAEQAAIVSLMAFESVDFKYNKNHFPGVPGQGSMFLPFLSLSIRSLPILLFLTFFFSYIHSHFPSYMKKKKKETNMK